MIRVVIQIMMRLKGLNVMADDSNIMVQVRES